MATTYHAALQELYVAYFNRPADPGGLDYWEGIVEAANGNLSAVSATFAASPEYKDAFAGKTNEQIVDQLYMNLFGHAADAGGKKFYADALTQGRITVDLVVRDIAGGAQGADDVAFSNKAKAALAFTAALDTDAEKAGYAGEDALALAKEFIAGITTDASYAAAVTPAALAEVINDVVHAGTPFVLVDALAALDAANDAVSDFLAETDLDEDEDTDTTEEDIEAAVTAAGEAIEEAGVEGYVDASTAVKAALVSDAQEALVLELADAEKAYATSVAAADKVTGLSDAIEAQTTAADAVEAADEAAADAGAVVLGAVAAYNGFNADADAEVADDGTVTGVIELNDDGELVLADDITEADNKGVTALLNAVIAREEAETAATAAATAAADAALAVEVLDLSDDAEDELVAVGALIELTGTVDEDEAPTVEQILDERAALEAAVEAEEEGAEDALAAFNDAIDAFLTANTTALSEDVVAKADAVDTAQEALDDLNDAVEGLGEAQALMTQLEGLKDNIAFAEESFELNDYNLPRLLTTASVSATSGSDIYLANEDQAAARIVNFGAAGDDVLYIGSGYKLNTTGDITKGVNADLEVFFVKSGTSTNVIVETSAFGSNTATKEVITITLTGVAPADLEFANGIITHA
ncbi:DUF4214 domain-containing protein [Pseudoduganella lutea]|uniref:DUF4214 domain-containing protein n=1 Tax=Pseudoduganella lutea TaxID=321985 RepID=A0A4P6L0I4_9BURK|nr:DUF4214 domain-containing protein [Pseudoduganella lutea]QBE64615.1 DUF4214 domain-containing protein [Pseudoduganella lutea]